MRCSRIFGALVFAAGAIAAAPTPVTSQITTDKGEQKARAAAQETVRNDLKVRLPGDRGAVFTSDQDITRQVEGRLSKDAQLKQVDVRTESGAVILTGAVPSIGASARASELARGVPGVRSVKNELTYEPGPTDDIVGPRTS